MPDVHLPQIDEHEDEEPVSHPPTGHSSRTKTILKIALELLLISMGVFLGIAGEQWRESARRHELAITSLRRLRFEVEANLQAVERVKNYHAQKLRELHAYFEHHDRKDLDAVQLQGLQPVNFAHTAWDLAISTQSLADIDADLTFALAQTYDKQQNCMELSRGILQAMYIRPPDENRSAYLQAVHLYYDDITFREAELVKTYNELLPRIDRALGQKP